jgi:hypothetical protein
MEVDMNFDYVLIAYESDTKLAELKFFSEKEKSMADSAANELRKRCPVAFVASRDAFSLALLRGTVMVFKQEQEHQRRMN